MDIGWQNARPNATGRPPDSATLPTALGSHHVRDFCYSTRQK
ncbi:hypothetical protein [Nocardiopsis tropica]|uniref:Uncharacterized protein n=1 Tax=Nocardiopsis tropica TaxID=109330 RepID=A0ABU7KMH6_9ACTN|nr:hypothetical protein [Nocardiopsis umidischolae]MEE2050466.1 hypothetical protein [Nocardiopsis umidischolae]